MTDTAKASPRPWYILPSEDGFRTQIASDNDGEPLVLAETRFFADVPTSEREREEADSALIVTAVNEYDALKAVEAAAREIETITQGYIDGYRSGQPFVIAGKQTEARDHLRAALAALDAIRKPPTGKTGEAKL